MGKIDQYQRAERVMLAVSKPTGVSLDDMRGKSRFTRVVEARRVAMVLMRKTLGLTLVATGRHFNKDHATVLHAERQHSNLMDVDRNYREYYNVCELAVENDELLKVKDSRDIIIALTERVRVLEEELKALKKDKVFNMTTRDIEFSEEWVGTVDCDIDLGEPQQWYDSNGDPGTPGIPPSIEVYRVWMSLKDREGNEIEVDVLPFLHEAGIIDEDDIRRNLEEIEFDQ